MTAPTPPQTDERLPLALGLSAEGRWLVFVQGGETKWYARTPTGEYAFGEHQGLYEWHRDAEGDMVRTDYTGGDQSPVHEGRRLIRHGKTAPRVRGLMDARADYDATRN